MYSRSGKVVWPLEPDSSCLTFFTPSLTECCLWGNYLVRHIVKSLLWVFLRECYLLLAYIVMMLLKKHKTLYICWKFGFKKVSPATHSKMIMRIVWGITASWLDVQQFCTTVIVSFRVINTSSLQSSTCNKFKIDSDWDIGRKCWS